LHEEVIRTTLATHGRLKVDAMSLGRTDDLYAVGLTSHATVNVMLSIEDQLGVEFPERLLRKSTFATIGAIDDALDEVYGEIAPGTAS
jgi:acyl carrier protein